MEISLIDFFNPEAVIKYGGLTLLWLIIFAETGLFFGFFLPGDSLLFVAGLLSDSEFIPFPVWLVITALLFSAIMGTMVGYAFGYKAGNYLNNWKDGFFYRKKYLELTQEFYKRNGYSTFILGRFLPVFRTFIPILAGIVKLDFKRFLLLNVVGAALWIIPLVLAGYWMGNRYPIVTESLEYVIAGMIVVTGLPLVVAWIRNRNNSTVLSSKQNKTSYE